MVELYNIDPDIQAALDEHLDKLAAIGTAGQLAVHFQSQGLKAECGQAHTCAIAESVGGALGLPARLLQPAVSYSSVAVWTEGNQVVAKADLSDDIREFITSFDAQLYPELIKQSY